MLQREIHGPWGGVVPNLAREAHEAAMDATIASALQQAGICEQELDAVAVTIGPGLSLCLKVYRCFAFQSFGTEGSQVLCHRCSSVVC